MNDSNSNSNSRNQKESRASSAVFGLALVMATCQAGAKQSTADVSSAQKEKVNLVIQVNLEELAKIEAALKGLDVKVLTPDGREFEMAQPSSRCKGSGI